MYSRYRDMALLYWRSRRTVVAGIDVVYPDARAGKPSLLVEGDRAVVPSLGQTGSGALDARPSVFSAMEAALALDTREEIVWSARASVDEG